MILTRFLILTFILIQPLRGESTLPTPEAFNHLTLAQKSKLFKVEEGAIRWSASGVNYFKGLKRYMRALYPDAQEVKTPALTSKQLYQKSGHALHYRDRIFAFRYGFLAAMNCPHILEIYNENPHVKADLPQHFLEFNTVFRNENPEDLEGAFRLREFTQDAVHSVVREDQVAAIGMDFFKKAMKVYRDMGFKTVGVRLARNHENFPDTLEELQESEALLKKVVETWGVPYSVTEQDKERVFYGPKADLLLRDGKGRLWQAGTFQVDFYMPRRMDVSYEDIDGTHKTPVLIHSAIYGSLERFGALALEQNQGIPQKLFSSSLK